MTTAPAPSGPLPRALALLSRYPIVPYIAFGVMAFVVFLIASFPYDTVRQRLSAEAAQQGWAVRIQSLGPGFFGVRARGVELSPLAAESATTPAPAPLVIDTLALRPGLFPPGVAFSAGLGGGTVSGSVARGSLLSVHVAVRELDLAKVALGGVQAAGSLRGDLDLEMPLKNDQPDPSHAQGKLTLQGEQIAILGGAVTVPLYGTPTEVSLPAAGLGALEVELPIEEGTATVGKLSVIGDDLQLSGNGTVRLDRRLPLSNVNVSLSLKATPEFQKRLGLLGSGLTLLPADANQPGWRTAKITGVLGHPNLGPGR